MGTSILTIIVVIVVIALLIITSQKGADKVEGKITIGAVLSLSGDAVADGESIRNGIELAKSDLQKQGVEVEIIYQDDQTDGKDTVSAISALSVQGVQALIGPTWSFLADAGVPVADQLKLVTVMPANTSEYVSAKSPYAFFTTIKVQQMVPTLAEWLKSNNKKTIAIVSNQGAWYETVGKAVEEAATLAGAKIIYSDSLVYGQEASALPTIIAKLKTLNADLLFTEIDSDQGVAVMLRKIQELKLSGDVMSVTTSVGRVLNSGTLDFNSANKFYVLAPKTSAEFQTKYEDVYNKKPTAYADTSYDSLMLLVDAIQNRGEVPLANYLREKTNHRGYANTYKFDANGDVVGGEWVVNTIR